MEIKVHVATIKFEEQTRPLTRTIAKQLHIQGIYERYDAIVQGKASNPLCKVRGNVVGSIREWLVLVENNGEFEWANPVSISMFPLDSQDQFADKADDLRSIPTIILL